MGIFNRKKHDVSPPLELTPPAQSRVEIELHKTASEEAAAKAQATNQHLNDLLVENGFTLKIFLAAGGHQPKESGKRNK